MTAAEVVLDATGDELDSLALVRAAHEMQMRLQAGSVELTGNEFGEFHDTPEGVKALRAVARAHLETLRGKWVDCQALGRQVEIRSRGIKEMMAFSGNPLKLRAMAALEQIIRGGQDPVREANYKAHKVTTVAYFRLRSVVHVAGKPVVFTVLIEEDVNGLLHYDLILEKTKAALDSSAAASEPVLTPDHDSGSTGSEIVSTDGHPVNQGAGVGILNLFLEGGESAVFDGAADLAPMADALAAANGLARVTMARELQALLAREETSQAREAALRRWFGNSKIRDDDGNPLVLYHATTKDFASFLPGGLDPTVSGHAIWFTDNKEHQPAAHNTSSRTQDYRDGTNVMPVYLKMERPLVIDDQISLDWARDVFAKGSREFPQLLPKVWVDEVTRDGEYDGIVFDGEALGWKPAAREFIVFKPEQVKSALGNSGAFDPTSPNILDAVVSPLARLRLATTLRTKVEQYAGAATAIQRLRLAQEIRALLEQMGVNGAVKVSPHAATLREVVAGEHDTEGFAEQYGMIQEAINALEEAGELAGEVEALAHQAITHWAEREEEIHG